MAFDPATQLRKGARVNPSTQYTVNMHTEEFLSRLAAHDLPLPMTELDFVLVFLDLILGGVAVPGLPRARYLRIMTGQRTL